MGLGLACTLQVDPGDQHLFTCQWPTRDLNPDGVVEELGDDTPGAVHQACLAGQVPNANQSQDIKRFGKEGWGLRKRN